MKRNKGKGKGKGHNRKQKIQKCSVKQNGYQLTITTQNAYKEEMQKNLAEVGCFQYNWKETCPPYY